MRIMNWYTGKSLSNFKWSIVGNPRLDWFSFTPPSDWSKKNAPLSQPIRCKTKTNPDLVARVFPLLGRFAGFYFEFLLVLNGMELSTDHVLVLAISLVLILQHFIEKRSIYLTL